MIESIFKNLYSKKGNQQLITIIIVILAILAFLLLSWSVTEAAKKIFG